MAAAIIAAMDHEVIGLLERLVAIDSVNPSLVAGAAGESELAGFVGDGHGRNGLDATVIEQTPGRPNVLVRGGGDRGGRRCCCADTSTRSASAAWPTRSPRGSTATACTGAAPTT